MSNFISYYWTTEALKNKNLIAAFQRLISPESSFEEKLKSFGDLLKSNNVVAQGITFDYYFYIESLGRYGVNNPFSCYLSQLLEKAREQLRTQAVTSATPEGKQVVGANYSSAFGVLTHLGEEKDLELISAILKSSSDIDVLFSGCLAAQKCLRMTKKNFSEIISSISRIIYDDRWPENLRVMAVRSLDDYEIPEVEEVLVTVSEKCLLPISAYAADILGNRNLARYRDLLQRLSDCWPDDARYPVSDVRDLLARKNKSGKSLKSE